MDDTQKAATEQRQNKIDFLLLTWNPFPVIMFELSVAYGKFPNIAVMVVWHFDETVFSTVCFPLSVELATS